MAAADNMERIGEGLRSTLRHIAFILGMLNQHAPFGGFMVRIGGHTLDISSFVHQTKRDVASS